MAQFVNKAKDFVAEKVAHVKKPEAELADVDLKHISRDAGATFNGRVYIYNPYDHSLPLREVSYTFKSNNRTIATGHLPEPGPLLPMERTMMEIPVRVPYSILVDLARDIGTDWDIDYTMEVGITVDLPVVGKYTMPLSRRGQFRLPTLSSDI